MAVRPDGLFAYLAGSTPSAGLGSACASQPTISLGRDAFVATMHLPGDGSSAVAHFTYLGGGADDFGTSIAYDATDGGVLVGGLTRYNTSNLPFPVTAGGLQTVQPGSSGVPFDNGFLVEVPKPVACAPDLVVTKTAAPAPVELGCEPLTFTIDVTNAGTAAATQVTVTDPLPAVVSLVSVTSSQETCTSTSTVVCELGGLAPGATATITIVTDVDPDTSTTQPVVNTATAVAVPADADPGDNADTVVVGLAPGSCGPVCSSNELAGLVVGGLTPAFSPSTYAYSIPTAPGGVVPLTATLCDPSRTLYVQGNQVASGTPVNAWLGNGSVSISIYQGWTKVGGYTLTVDANLPPAPPMGPGDVIVGLDVPGLSPGFDAAVATYTAPAPGSGFLPVTATLADPSLSLYDDGTPVVSGQTWPAWAPAGAEIDIVAYQNWVEVARVVVQVQ